MCYVTDMVGHPHLTVLREASGLACVDPPEIFYELHIDPELRDPNSRKKKFMSKPQLEAVAYACQSHSQFFEARYVEVPIDPPKKVENQELVDDASSEELDETSDEELLSKSEDSFEPMEVDEEIKTMDYRLGFLLGDGTGKVVHYRHCQFVLLSVYVPKGTGKTRILAGIVYEYYVGGGRRCVWVTVNRGLFANAIESICYLVPEVNVKVWEGVGSLIIGSELQDKLEILHVTYRDLVSIQNAQKLESWLGVDFDGLVSCQFLLLYV